MKKFFLQLKIYFIPCQENDHKPKFLKSNFLFFLVIFLIALKVFFSSFTIILPYTNFFAQVSKPSLLSLINGARKSSGLEPLSEDSKLNSAAYMKAQDMLEKDYFAHTSPDGKGLAYWLSQVNYSYRYAGENLGADFLSSVELFNAWMASPSHRANIMSPNYQKTGIAILSGDFQGHEMIVIVQMFGGFGQVSQTASSSSESNQPQLAQNTPIKSVSSSSPISVPTQVNTPAPPTSTSPTVVPESSVKEKASPQKEIQKPLPVSQKLSTPTPTLSEKEKKILEELKKTNRKPVITGGEVKGVQIENTGLKYKILSNIVINGDKISKISLLSALGLVILSLFFSVFIKIKIQHKDLILRGLLYTLILLVMLLLNTAAIVKIIPHTLGIM